MSNHVLFTDADDYLPNSILDRNGCVALKLCKVCGAGEAELDERGCIDDPSYKDLEKALSSAKTLIETQSGIASILRKDNLKCQEAVKTLVSERKMNEKLTNDVEQWKLEAEYLNKRLQLLRQKYNDLHDIGNAWHWQSDSDNHLESLVCPILISPEQLRKLLNTQNKS